MSDTTPTYIAYCATCGGLIACVVADVASPSMSQAVQARDTWIRRGYRVVTETVHDVRTHPDPLGHLDACPKKRRPRKASEVATS